MSKDLLVASQASHQRRLAQDEVPGEIAQQDLVLQGHGGIAHRGSQLELGQLGVARVGGGQRPD
eukprot:7728167-Pyramimonas_sp.AAC.1